MHICGIKGCPNDNHQYLQFRWTSHQHQTSVSCVSITLDMNSLKLDWDISSANALEIQQSYTRALLQNIVVVLYQEEIIRKYINLPAYFLLRKCTATLTYKNKNIWISKRGDFHDEGKLKQKYYHVDEIFVSGCTGSCQFDNFQYSHWQKFHQH